MYSYYSWKMTTSDCTVVLGFPSFKILTFCDGGPMGFAFGYPTHEEQTSHSFHAFVWDWLMQCNRACLGVVIVIK